MRCNKLRKRVSYGQMTKGEFEILARSLRPRLLRTARQYTDSDTAEDVVQDTMLRLWSMRDSLDRYRSVEALAVVAAKRLALNELRRLRPELHAELGETGDTDPSAEELMIERQESQHLDRVLASLPDSQQTLVRLRHIEGYDNASIAALLGTSEGAVRTALSRARRRIAEIFNVTANS